MMKLITTLFLLSIFSFSQCIPTDYKEFEVAYENCIFTTHLMIETKTSKNTFEIMEELDDIWENII
ncbi:MAG: hypothetical protein ACI97N_001475 [Cognaticolwellia sp.]|jgi:hypothetical protein